MSRMLAHIYIRVSTDEQVDGYSLDAQERACRLYCELHSLTVEEVHIDDGYSGTSPDRPAYSRLLKLVVPGQTVVCHKLDRWGRNTRLVLDSLHNFNERGIAFVSVSEQIDFSTPIGKVLLTLIASFSQFYVDNLSQETAKGNREKAQLGHWVGAVPFGYKKLDKGTIVPSDDADTVREIYRLYLAGHSYRDIVRILNEQGKRMYRWRERDRVEFSRESIRTILKNRAYLGYVSSGGKEYQGNHEPLIREGDFEEVRELTQERAYQRKGEKHVWLLKGMIRCARCGSKMWGHIGGGSGITRSYVCSRHQRWGTCDQCRVAAALIEYQTQEIVSLVAGGSIREVLVTVWVDGEVVAVTPVEAYRKVLDLLGWELR